MSNLAIASRKSRSMLLLLMPWAFSACLIGATSALAAPTPNTRTFKVHGTADIFFAQRAVPFRKPWFGTRPKFVEVTPGIAVTLTVAGMVSCNNGDIWNGPDDTAIDGGSGVRHLHGISGYYDQDSNMVLVGVFTDGTKPQRPLPGHLVFANDGSGDYTHSFVSIRPALDQTFFIGDGYVGTGQGDLQQFVPPPSAARLYFGFADSNLFHGKPSWYDDNLGYFTVNVIRE